MKKLLFLGLCFTAASFASPIFDSITGQTTQGGYWVTWPPDSYPALWASFTVPNNYVVTSLSLLLDNNIGNVGTFDATGVASTEGILTVSLSADGAGTPGTSLGTLGTVADSSIPGDSGCMDSSFATCTFSLVSVSITPEELSAGTYWIGLSDSASPNPAIVWGHNDGSGTNVAAGSTYDVPDGPSNNGDSSYAYQMTINGYVSEVTTPEPTPGVFGLIGLAALLTIYRRRRAVS
jgi:MYXO-CTERM domain-containing protein